MNTEEKKANPLKRLEYGRTYIVPQKYENLLSLTAAIKSGTIFRDLIRPYTETE